MMKKKEAEKEKNAKRNQLATHWSIDPTTAQTSKWWEIKCSTTVSIIRFVSFIFLSLIRAFFFLSSFVIIGAAWSWRQDEFNAQKRPNYCMPDCNFSEDK